jgi:GTPase SAR1 family protein
MSDEDIAAYEEYQEQYNPFEDEAYQKHIEAELKRYEKLGAEYLNILRNNDHDEYEAFIVRNKSDLDRTPIGEKEYYRITETNEIYLFQFKFLTGFKKVFNSITSFKQFWIDTGFSVSPKILLIDIGEIKNIKTLIDFCKECSLSLRASKVKDPEIQEYHLKNHDVLERDCKIFLENFLQHSDYNKTTIPLLRILINSEFLENLKNIFATLKKKLIFSYLLNDKTFHDYPILDEFSTKDHWSNEFIPSLKEEVKKRIQEIKVD